MTVQPEQGRQLLVVGEGPVADALEAFASVLGWVTTVARTTEQVDAALPSSTAVVVTSHDDGLDAPALALSLAAVRAPAGPAYVAAMGSRRTQARRREWLLAHGVTEAALEALHAPAGLDIGADTPPEIALSVLAELVATLRGAAGAGSLRDRPGPIHPTLAPGEATCPTG
jgi:xanthine/CO dehydrogenase XdhC/CoxF family maturation factor